MLSPCTWDIRNDNECNAQPPWRNCWGRMYKWWGMSMKNTQPSTLQGFHPERISLHLWNLKGVVRVESNTRRKLAPYLHHTHTLFFHLQERLDHRYTHRKFPPQHNTYTLQPGSSRIDDRLRQIRQGIVHKNQGRQKQLQPSKQHT